MLEAPHPAEPAERVPPEFRQIIFDGGIECWMFYSGARFENSPLHEHHMFSVRPPGISLTSRVSIH